MSNLCGDVQECPPCQAFLCCCTVSSPHISRVPFNLFPTGDRSGAPAFLLHYFPRCLGSPLPCGPVYVLHHTRLSHAPTPCVPFYSYILPETSLLVRALFPFSPSLLEIFLAAGRTAQWSL